MIIGVIDGEDVCSVDNDYEEKELREYSSSGKILCPVCQKPYIYCNGEYVSAYFRHKTLGDCEDKYGEPETEEHILGKTNLFNWLKTFPQIEDAKLEAWLPETKQRPDILFRTERGTYVIEYQCTPISTQYAERHRRYRKAGITDYWVCGTSRYRVPQSVSSKFAEEYEYGKINPKTKDMRLNKELERVADAFYNPYTNEMTMRGQFIFGKLNNKITYPSFYYTYPLDKTRIARDGIYAPEFLKEAKERDVKYASSDLRKGVFQRARALAMYLKDGGCDGITFDSFERGKSENNIATIMFSTKSTYGRGKNRYFIFFGEKYVSIKSRGYEGGCHRILYKPNVPADIFDKVTEFLNSGKYAKL
jgi:competence CoiA-like predicted nuclease